MKAKYLYVFGLLIAAFFLSAFVVQNNGTIKGIVIPPENALRAYAVMGTDTVKSNITDGYFEVSKLKAGNYQLWIEALEPYQHKLITNVIVREGEFTDLGEIQLSVK
ncbi:carboxypeptidase regulatory-like domain-containing protein [Lacibacter luteus]|uniref:Carboxypeptidase regulatory-like domain-containing protein n=1 Tax=Lacibacter luteus TaxID=2508719 RepID=A0A4Q1CFR1_9BACT|nr:carboxypeptidase regulatory-like domain-containing protein [Lacibacter luteus]RXK58866.1 carboxypeptidase regulatory-like domain-containing protein [Lacibacter luteus]